MPATGISTGDRLAAGCKADRGAAQAMAGEGALCGPDALPGRVA